MGYGHIKNEVKYVREMIWCADRSEKEAALSMPFDDEEETGRHDASICRERNRWELLDDCKGIEGSTSEHKEQELIII